MANINESDDWASGVYQYAIGDVLDGGPESSETLPIRQLANRSLFQRLRNVTPWDAALALAVGYPSGACVMHSGVSWRSKVLNSVEPGTDELKWERWGYSNEELKDLIELLVPKYLPFQPPGNCLNTGPSEEDDKTRTYKSPLGELWMWLGDAWKVVAGLHGKSLIVANVNHPAASFIDVHSEICHRNGRIHLAAHHFLAATGQTQASGAVILKNGGVVTGAVCATDFPGQANRSSPSIHINVVEGDLIKWQSYAGFGPVVTSEIRISFQYVD